ncbi:hypothetical protein DL96DRAFT_1593070 [Flagelloscypha sp. PMI_526]|nr:hypothetical protein DL96DRAFT_1593070 [Flagelloscypha sp. PMI_526]
MNIFTPSHVQLLNSSNHPAKLTKFGGELEKRVKAECRKTRSGNLRSRASLLITLAILRSLALLSPSLISCVDATLRSALSDLEVVARAASVFTAWTTYTDGHLIGADSSMTKEYLSILKHFGSLAASEVKDIEKTVLFGLSTITGALNSEALYNDPSQFKAQVSVILQPLLTTIFQTPMAILNDQATNIQKAPSSPYLAEFRSPASIHAHVDADVVVEWAQYQYRYVVPTWTVERLIQTTESPTSDMQTTLLAMATRVLNSPVPLINLSTSDLISNLITLLLRKVAIDAKDSILGPLVKCIASLGSHVYYSDQIQDLAGELISRLVLVELQGVPGSKSDESRTEAIRCILAGLLGLVDSAQRHDHATKQNRASTTPAPAHTSDSTPADAVKQEATDRLLRRTRVPPDIWEDTLSLLCDTQYSVRADYSAGLVSYVTHEYAKRGDSTDSDGVRRVHPLTDGPIQHAATIAAVLHGDDFGVKFLNTIQAYLYILAISADLGLHTTPSSASTPAPEESQLSVVNIEVNIQPATPNGGLDSKPNPSLSADSSDQHSGHNNGRRSFAHPPRSRKNSGVKRLLERVSPHVSSSASACLADYAHILDIVTTLHQQLPVRALLTSVPMLLALETTCRDAQEPHSTVTKLRIEIIRLVVAKTWLLIGNIWDCADLIMIVESTLSTLPDHVSLPVISPSECGSLEPPRDPISFPESIDSSDVEIWVGVPSDKALFALVDNSNVQEAIGLDRESLLVRLSTAWTPQSALSNPVGRSATLDTNRPDGASPLLKISPALMHIENISLQSLTRSIRGVGVTDLREALEGRSSMSTSNLARPPSLSTMEHPGSSVFLENRLTPTRSRTSKRRNQPPGSGEVKDVLNKLGIGKQGTQSRLKSSFPTKSLEPRSPPS